jgi:xanthine dehydrogenase accessory factor
LVWEAPAGLDLGAITPDEMAISILAEIVAVRRGKDARGAAPEDINQRAR